MIYPNDGDTKEDIRHLLVLVLLNFFYETYLLKITRLIRILKTKRNVFKYVCERKSKRRVKLTTSPRLLLQSCCVQFNIR